MLALPGASFLYMGEELGLPEWAQLPDDAREDPTWRRSGFRVRGRDGARVPLPWRKDAPHAGFSLAKKTWMPMPEDWGRFAAASQRGRAGSTFETYRTALWLRRNRALGTGSLAWVNDLPGCSEDSIIALVNRSTLVVANLGVSALRLPPGLRLLHASEDLPMARDGAVLMPTDTTVWADLG